MDESFWFLTEDEQDRPERSGVPFETRQDYAPFQESMRGDRSRPRRAPSTDQKKVRRQIYRSGASYTAAGAYDAVDWDTEFKNIEGETIHRGVGVNLPEALHRHMMDESVPREHRAHALLEHIAGSREDNDRRTGLGMHWSISDRVAENFAEKSAEHYADVNKGDHGDHDFSWGSVPGDIDHHAIADHLEETHGISRDRHPVNPYMLQHAHESLHRGHPLPGQQELFPAEPYQDPERAGHASGEAFREPPEAKGKPGMAVMLRTVPEREHIDEDPYSNPNKGGDVYHPQGHGEAEVPLRAGAQVSVTGVSWKPVHTSEDEDEDDWGSGEYRKHGGWTHHEFGKPEPREAMRKDAAYGEGERQYVIPTEKLPSIPEDQARPKSFLDELLQSAYDQAGMNVSSPRKPGGFDEPFQQERFQQRQRGREVSRRRKEMPDQEKTPEGRGADMLGDLIGEVGTEREVRDARPPGETRDEHKMRWFKQRWNQTFEPLGHNEEGKARSRRNTRKRWEKIMGPTACDHPDCPPWEHHEGGYRPKYSAKTATVLNTQIERLNPGDQIRTPTGQTSEVKKVRPHETESTLLYLDTDMGTSTVKRGTDFQVVPRNSQQQELPDTGNPMGDGNSGTVPGAGRTPGGAGSVSSTAPGTCPNCGNSGSLHLQGGNYMCSVCGFTVSASGSPGNLMFTNQPSGQMPARRAPGDVPRAHVWASRYSTVNYEGSQIARRARQVSGGDQ